MDIYQMRAEICTRIKAGAMPMPEGMTLTSIRQGLNAGMCRLLLDAVDVPARAMPTQARQQPLLTTHTHTMTIPAPQPQPANDTATTLLLAIQAATAGTQQAHSKHTASTGLGRGRYQPKRSKTVKHIPPIKYLGVTVGNNDSQHQHLNWRQFYVTFDTKEYAYEIDQVGIDVNRVSKVILRREMCRRFDADSRGGFGKMSGKFPRYEYESEALYA